MSSAKTTRQALLDQICSVTTLCDGLTSIVEEHGGKGELAVAVHDVQSAAEELKRALMRLYLQFEIEASANGHSPIAEGCSQAPQSNV